MTEFNLPLAVTIAVGLVLASIGTMLIAFLVGSTKQLMKLFKKEK